MIRRYTFLLFITILANYSWAQQGTITYKCEINDGILPMPSKANFTIYFTSNESIEIPLALNTKSTDIDENTRIEIIKGKNTFILKRNKSKELVLSDYLGFKPRLIIDTLQNFNWVLTKEKKKIVNFNCIKATTRFRGRNYIAWFTEDVPIQNGPWKFCGLPGLIVKINDDKLIFNWELTGINLKAKFNRNVIAIPKEYAEDKAITHRQFIGLHNKMVANNKKMAKVVETGKDGSWATKEIILPPKIELF